MSGIVVSIDTQKVGGFSEKSASSAYLEKKRERDAVDECIV